MHIHQHYAYRRGKRDGFFRGVFVSLVSIALWTMAWLLYRGVIA